MRTRYLFVYVLVCDALMIFGGVPLLRATWLAVVHHAARATLIELLAANMALLVLCLAGFFASAVAGTRGLQFAFRRFSRSSARPKQAWLSRSRI